MTSLSEVYEGGVRTVVGRRLWVLAVVLFAAGVTMGAVAILLTTTGLRSSVGLTVTEARKVAGVLAGVGLPAAMIGMLVALPASDETRAAAVIGGSISVFGVILFVSAYPGSWLENQPALAIATTAIYTLGALVTFWCLFVAVATFSRRRDPGGTARVEITDEGKVRLVTSDSEESGSASETASVPSRGGIGLVGRDPDGNVPTQTNDSTDTGVRTAEPGSGADSNAGGSVDGISGTAPESASEMGSRPQEDSGRESGPTANANPGPETSPTSDGGTSVARDSGAELISGSGDGQPDIYCGNCAYFEYVEVGGDLDPYCGYHNEFMEDLEACDQWRTNTSTD